MVIQMWYYHGLQMNLPKTIPTHPIKLKVAQVGGTLLLAKEWTYADLLIVLSFQTTSIGARSQNK